MAGPNGHAPPAFEWNGRPVKLVEFSIRDGREVRAAYQVDGETGMWAVLQKAARYADDDTPLFASADEIEAQPFRLQQRLMRMAAAALDLNGFTEAPEPKKPDDGETGEGDSTRPH